jgi:hypothetical protein
MGFVTINLCLQTLVEKGLAKMPNFGQSKNKLRYACSIKPAGVAEKSKLTAEFLRRKMAEYETLHAGIEALQAEMNSVKSGPQ